MRILCDPLYGAASGSELAAEYGRLDVLNELQGCAARRGVVPAVATPDGDRARRRCCRTLFGVLMWGGANLATFALRLRGTKTA